MITLGIESSCDETAVAIYDSKKGLLGHKIHTQVDLHAEFGGVVPELASRDHIRYTLPLIKSVLKQAKINLSDLEGIAYTKGPGLVGTLFVGATIARSLGFSLNIPTIGINHMEASSFIGSDA
jgi:N6-L-threonylcarbamoyladenine synthase